MIQTSLFLEAYPNYYTNRKMEEKDDSFSSVSRFKRNNKNRKSASG